jgi:enoyl-CoA hydratase
MDVTTERRGSVAWVRLHAPRSNALTPRLVSELAAALRDAEADPAVACLALTSEGRNFCTGADLDLLREVGDDPLEESNYAALGSIYELFCALQDAAVPTIAGIGGFVVGAGINLALVCDMRIVADDVRVRGFASAGVHPGGGHLSMLLRNLPPVTAAAVALFGQDLDAAGTVASGFAYRQVSRENLDASVEELARSVGDDAPLARRVAASYRQSLHGNLSPESAVLLERASQLWSLRRKK